MLQLKNVGFKVDDHTILKDVSLSIDKGQHTSINGPSGAGKSTVLKILAGLTPFTSGEVLFDKQLIEEIPYQTYRKEVSYCYQAPQLFGETVEDNVSFPAVVRGEAFDKERARRLLDDVQLSYIDFSKEITSLSGGERQRVALVRNLMYPPKVLLLDEITAGIDDETAQIIWEWLMKKANEHEMTLVWISHNKKEQEMALQKIYLKDGQRVESEVEVDE